MPDDEYAPEIERIAQRLATAKALSLEMVQAILHETFAEFFDDELAGLRNVTGRLLGRSCST
jgi:hypothetical protein